MVRVRVVNISKGPPPKGARDCQAFLHGLILGLDWTGLDVSSAPYLDDYIV